MVSPAKNDTLGIVDNNGRFVFPINVGMQINLRSYNNRELTYFGISQTGGTLGFSGYVRTNTALTRFDTIKMVGPYQADFHEGFATSDSTFLILGSYNVVTDLSKYVNGGFVDATLIAGVIQHVTKSGRVLFEWKSLDHIPYQDAVEDVDFTQPTIDILHINAIVQDADGGWLLSCRHLDEIVKINGTTGKVEWRLGGSKSKKNQFRFLNDTVNGFFGFSHQHSVTRTSKGTLLMFDNGNLKPLPRSSRVVEYEVNEATKTVKKVFEYSPQTPVYATTMGSVVEMPNQNILVGFGSAVELNGTISEIAAQEIRRTGEVVATIKNLPLPRLSAYRILKSTFGMTGIQKTVSAAGNLEFANADSTTSITLQTSTVARPAVVTVERHHYAPRNIAGSSEATYFYAPVRWGIRIDDTLALKGKTKIRFNNARGVDNPSVATIMFRSKEGTGTFTPATATYSASDSSWTIQSISQGEVAVAFTRRLDPELIFPTNRSVDVSQSPRLRWYSLLFATSYEIQLSLDSTFNSVTASFTTSDTSYVPPVLKNNATYWWRVRKISSRGKSLWSATWRFTVELNAPVIVSPDTTKAISFVTKGSAFRWMHVEGASKYRITIVDTTQAIVFDSLLSDTLIYPATALPFNSKLRWSVRALADSTYSKPSRQYTIGTAPKQPVLMYPEPNIFLPLDPKSTFTWRNVEGAIGYHLFVFEASGRKLVIDSTTNEVTLPMQSLQPSKQYVWSCRTIGSFGESESDERVFTIAERMNLGKPVVDQSLPRTGLSHQTPVQLAWQPVNGALTYHVQIANDVVFDNPIGDTVVSEPSVSMRLPQSSALYAWRVQARNGFDVSPWSDTVYLSTNIDSSAVLTPVYPVHGATDAKVADVFRFVSNGTFDGYEIDVSRDPRLESIDFKFYCYTDSASYSFLTLGTRYYWKVVGTSAKRGRVESNVSTMVTDGQTDIDSQEDAHVGLYVIRNSDGIYLQNKTFSSISRIALYTVLGECLYSRLGPISEAHLPMRLDFSGPVYIVVTFSSGKTYVVGA